MEKREVAVMKARLHSTPTKKNMEEAERGQRVQTETQVPVMVLGLTFLKTK
jgi:hypothetical protein